MATANGDAKEHEKLVEKTENAAEEAEDKLEKVGIVQPMDGEKSLSIWNYHLYFE